MTLKVANVVVLGLAVLAPLFSGCLGGDGGGNGGGVDAAASYEGGNLPETSEEAEITSDLGALTGYVLTEEYTPIAGATVLLEEIGMTTDAALDGSYTFSLLEPGEYKAIASATGYEPMARQVIIDGGTVLRESFQLVGIPGMHPHRELLEFKAFLECGTGAAITGKPALEPARPTLNTLADTLAANGVKSADGLLRRTIPNEWNETNPFGAGLNACGILPILTEGTPAEGSSNDAFLFTWEHHAGTIQDIVIEMAWRAAPLAGREFSILVEPVVSADQCVNDCKADEVDNCDSEWCYYWNAGYRYVDESGGSPLRVTFGREELEAITSRFNERETVQEPTGYTAGQDAVMKPQNFTEAATFGLRIFAESNQLGDGYPADYALNFQQPADLYVTQFYVEGAPETYTAVPE